MTDSINTKLHAHDKMLENINAKLDEFSSTLKNQLSFDKMIETQLA